MLLCDRAKQLVAENPQKHARPKADGRVAAKVQPARRQACEIKRTTYSFGKAAQHLTESQKEALRYLWWVAYLHPLRAWPLNDRIFPRQEAAFLRCDMDIQAGMLARLFKRSLGTQRRVGALRCLV